MNKKKYIWIIIPIILIFLILGSGLYYFYKKDNIVQQKEKQPQAINSNDCLTNDETESYKIKERKRGLGDVIADITLNVINRQTNLIVNTFQINDVFKNYHLIEIHRCGVYVIRFFNYDPKISKQKSEFYAEFWRYYYNGKGTKVLTLEDFSYDFRVNSIEKYIVLEKDYLGKDDYALIIKDLNTKEDIFSLPAKEIVKQYPNLVGNFNMRDWTKDSRYFWGDIFDGADVLAIFRIDSTTWKWEIFEVPSYTMGGTALNAEYGYITYDDGPPWTGDIDFDEINKEKWLKEGKKLNFYLYNLFTKENILLTTVDDPLWNFKPQWLSDAELQYEMPTGEKKIYIVK